MLQLTADRESPTVLWRHRDGRLRRHCQRLQGPHILGAPPLIPKGTHGNVVPEHIQSCVCKYNIAHAKLLL